ncbi:MAG: hypothetical protein Q8922_07470 [Bacteroidota bacterium]|nr:hypothetical protein [Bacteroidota bacterium]MDP4287761.1 hypothetical protein [Bacteroidota bacterium]
MTISIVPAPATDLRGFQSRVDDRVDYDLLEVAIGFAKNRIHRLSSSECADFGTTTFGDVTFRRLDPLEEPFRVADTRLQSRLESLCESLRAKY